jgi:hypothetical protein
VAALLVPVLSISEPDGPAAPAEESVTLPLAPASLALEVTSMLPPTPTPAARPAGSLMPPPTARSIA